MDNEDLIDKDKLCTFLASMQQQAEAFAFSAKPHIAIQAYAQAAAYGRILMNAIEGEFDLIPEGTTTQ